MRLLVTVALLWILVTRVDLGRAIEMIGSRLRTAKFLLEEQRIRYRLRSEIENNP
jgi:hypothetical protein